MTAMLEAGRNLVIGAPAETLLALGVAAGLIAGDGQLGPHRAPPGRGRGRTEHSTIGLGAWPTPVTLEVESEGAARIILNRPDSLNAWNEELGRDLAAALERARPTTRCGR